MTTIGHMWEEVQIDIFKKIGKLTENASCVHKLKHMQNLPMSFFMEMSKPTNISVL